MQARPPGTREAGRPRGDAADPGCVRLHESGVLAARARRGPRVRHLVLPDDAAGTADNIMGQDRPCHRADERPEIDRRPTELACAGAVTAARRAGLHRLDGPGRIF